MENTYDVLVIEFQKGDKSAGAISIKKADIDVMVNMHGQTLEGIAGDMAKTLFEAIQKQEANGVEG
jgi:hypothetical protein